MLLVGRSPPLCKRWSGVLPSAATAATGHCSPDWALRVTNHLAELAHAWRAQEAQLPDSANLRVLAALRGVLASLSASAPPPEPRPPSRAASPFAALGGGLHHASWASDSLDSLATAGSVVRQPTSHEVTSHPAPFYAPMAGAHSRDIGPIPAGRVASAPLSLPKRQ